MNQTSHDTLSADTLQSDAKSAGSRGPGVACLTIVCHPDLSRVGERCLLTGLLAGQPQRISRADGLFALPGSEDLRPLTDPHISRSPVTLRHGGRPGMLTVDLGTAVTYVDGAVSPAAQLSIDAAQLSEGVCLRFGSRTLLLLHESHQVPPCAIDGILGDGDAIGRLRASIVAAAKHNEPVLIRGETGTGKELVAQALHSLSSRASRPMLSVNMATLSEAMAASALFGHVRGAFTGADRTHHGLFERADGGVLFLDEIGDTPASVQPMLLRVLETGLITPLGAEKERRVDVRVVTATDRDLNAAASDGSFRTPLLHRIAGQVLHVPPLRERRDDIGRLLVHFIGELAREEGKSDLMRAKGPGERPVLRVDWMESLLRSPCAGNVRELRNVARGIALGLTPSFESSGETRRSDLTTLPPPPRVPGDSAMPTSAPDDSTLLRALEENDYVPERAAKQLGIASSSIHYFMRNSALIRRAIDLTDEEIRRALAEHQGDLKAAARELRVSYRALSMTNKQRGL